MRSAASSIPFVAWVTGLTIETVNHYLAAASFLVGIGVGARQLWLSFRKKK